MNRKCSYEISKQDTINLLLFGPQRPVLYTLQNRIIPSLQKAFQTFFSFGRYFTTLFWNLVRNYVNIFFPNFFCIVLLIMLFIKFIVVNFVSFAVSKGVSHSSLHEMPFCRPQSSLISFTVHITQPQNYAGQASTL
jgi:hypothetical protein